MNWLLWLACAKHVGAPVPNDPLDEPLPVDPGVLQGQLDNGLRWYVEQNAEPKQRAVLRLVVDAGSVLEDDDQRGLAHFVEHMAFNGTEHFPGNQLVGVLESMGAEFGPHINAHTSFDETVYKLFVPTDDAAAFDQALLVLHDWASGLTFDPTEASKERGVVLEEWRTHLGAQRRIEDVTIPALFYGSQYAERLPIGTEESLRTFDPAAAERFYRDWYRPDLMAVIAVGDFDAEQVAAQIRERFGDLPDPGEGRERVRPEIPAHADTKYAIVADPEIPRGGVQILAKRDDVEQATHRSYHDDLVKQLAWGVLNERLGDLANGPNPPFLGAGAGEDRLSPTEGAVILSAGVANDGVERAYEAMLTEARRIRELGVTAAELDRAKARVLRGYENLLKEIDQEDSTSAAEEIVRVFTNGESMPGTAYEVELARKWVPEISADEVKIWAANLFPDDSRVVIVTEPADATPPPTAERLAAIEAQVAAAPLAPLAEGAEIGPVVSDLPPPGAIATVDRTHEADLGFVGYQLSNGVKVWAKRTDFKADEVLFTALSQGGESKVSDADLPSVRLLSSVAAQSGVGPHDLQTYEQWLAGKSLSVGLFVQDTGEGVSGSASPQDLESALQVVSAMFRTPRLTEDGFDQTVRQWRASIEGRTNNPGVVFDDAWRARVWKTPRYAPWTLATLEQARLDRVRALYGERFGDASDFVFTFVGALPDDFERLLTTYLATLPAQGRHETFTDLQLRQTPGQLQTAVQGGTDPQARVRLAWRGDFRPNQWEDRIRLYAVGEALETLLRDALREDLGGTYGAGVSASESYEPIDRYTIQVEFGCDPARVEELKVAALRVVADLRTKGPSEELAQQIREGNRRDREQQLRTNGFWLGGFSGALRRGADPKMLLTYDQRNQALTPAVIRDAAKRLLVDADRVEGELTPSPSQVCVGHRIPTAAASRLLRASLLGRPPCDVRPVRLGRRRSSERSRYGDTRPRYGIHASADPRERGVRAGFCPTHT